MFTYAKLAMLFLQLANTLANLARSKQMMDAGADRAIAQASAGILKDTQVAKEIMAQVMGMTESQVDDALKALEP